MSRHRDGWTMVQPGCWIDLYGDGHVYPGEIIDELQRRHPEIGFRHTPEDYALVISTAVQEFRSQFPGIDIVTNAANA